MHRFPAKCGFPEKKRDVPNNFFYSIWTTPPRRLMVVASVVIEVIQCSQKRKFPPGNCLFVRNSIFRALKPGFGQWLSAFGPGFLQAEPGLKAEVTRFL